MRKIIFTVGLVALVFSFLMTGPPAQAADAENPTLLAVTVTTSSGETSHVDLDLDALRAIGETSFATHTIWTEGEQTFTGVRLADFLRHFNISTGMMSVYAVNDYSVEIPVEEALQNDALIAYERNGKPMNVRNKGPLWIVYPYDSDKRYQSEVYYSRSVWQLTRVEIAA